MRDRTRGWLLITVGLSIGFAYAFLRFAGRDAEVAMIVGAVVGVLLYVVRWW